MERVSVLTRVTSRPRLAATATIASLACALTVATLPAQSSTAVTPYAAQDDRTRPTIDPRPIDERPASRRQTSDGVPGIVVGPPVASDVDGRAGLRALQGTARNDVTYQIAPGITLREWDQVDGRQPVGQVRANLVTVDLDAPNISVEYLASKYVPARKPVSRLGSMAGAITAVNGDFFDISDTGAPLGVGVRRGEGLVQGPSEGGSPRTCRCGSTATSPGWARSRCSG